MAGDDDWLCFMDRDICLLSPNTQAIIEENILIHKDAGLLTCLTNRVGNLHQCYNRQISEVSDIKHHYRIAMQREDIHRNSVTFTTGPISGFLMCISKRVWKRLPELRQGLLGVDTDISRGVLAMGKKIAIMQGVYVFHYYRLHNGIHDKTHLLTG